VVWDPVASKTLSVKTQRSKVDYNIFEGDRARLRLAYRGGGMVYANGELRVERGPAGTSATGVCAVLRRGQNS
jgi:dihydropyrimidinase